MLGAKTFSMARIVKVLRFVTIGALLLWTLFIALNIGSEYFWDHRRKKQASAIIAAYRSSAAAGTVVQSTSDPDAIQVWSGCWYSLPQMVRVKTPSGAVHTFWAESSPKTTAWTFRPLFITETNGQVRDVH